MLKSTASVKGHQEVRLGGRVISWLAATINGADDLGDSKCRS